MDSLRRAARPRGPLRLLCALAVAAGVVLAAGEAAAHVTISPTSAAAGATVVLRVSVDHGCDAAPTTGLSIQVPQEVGAVDPATASSWTSTTDEQRDGTRVVSYVARTPVPDGTPILLELEVTLPESAGVVVFPTVQTCAGTELAWLQVGQGGTDEEDLELPAPTLVVTAAEEGGSGGPATALLVGVLASGLLGAGLVRTLLRRRR